MSACPECGQYDGTIYEGMVPGHLYGSNWEWVPCQNHVPPQPLVRDELGSRPVYWTWTIEEPQP